MKACRDDVVVDINSWSASEEASTCYEQVDLCVVMRHTSTRSDIIYTARVCVCVWRCLSDVTDLSFTCLPASVGCASWAVSVCPCVTPRVRETWASSTRYFTHAGRTPTSRNLLWLTAWPSVRRPATVDVFLLARGQHWFAAMPAAALHSRTGCLRLRTRQQCTRVALLQIGLVYLVHSKSMLENRHFTC